MKVHDDCCETRYRAARGLLSLMRARYRTAGGYCRQRERSLFSMTATKPYIARRGLLSGTVQVPFGNYNSPPYYHTLSVRDIYLLIAMLSLFTAMVCYTVFVVVSVVVFEFFAVVFCGLAVFLSSLPSFMTSFAVVLASSSPSSFFVAFAIVSAVFRYDLCR